MRKVYINREYSTTIVVKVPGGWYVSKSLTYHSSLGTGCSTHAIVVPDVGHLTDLADFAGANERERAE
jgi:hypothetical protein